MYMYMQNYYFLFSLPSNASRTSKLMEAAGKTFR